MPMNAAYLNAVRDHGQSLITHIGLGNGSGTELAGGSPAYARKAVTWTDTSTGVSSPSADLVFDVEAGDTVGEWIGYSASSGGTAYGGDTFTAVGPYAAQGTFTLTASITSITHSAA